MKIYITMLLVMCCLWFVVPGPGLAVEAKLTEKKISKLKIVVPYNEVIDMSVSSHAEKTGGRFSAILENKYVKELEQKKEIDRNFRR